MRADDLIARVTALAEADERVRALFLGGSYGAGVADTWSDVDLIAVVPADVHGGFVDGAREWIGQASPVLLWKAILPPFPVFTAVLESWTRCDLTVTVPQRLAGAQDRWRPLLDRDGLFARLPETLAQRAPDPAVLAGMAEEFIRCVGLLPVAMGRGEHAVGVTGVGLLRAQLIALLIEGQGLPQPPGALHLSRLLGAEEMTVVERLPAAEANRASVIGATRACAEAFLPRARALVAAAGGRWPEALEAALRAHLRRTLGEVWA